MGLLKLGDLLRRSLREGISDASVGGLRAEEVGLRDAGRLLGGGGGVSLSRADLDAPPLIGMETRVKIPRLGTEIEVGPNRKIREVAASYMDDAGLPYDPPRKYAKVNPDRARRIATAFELMQNNPTNPVVRAAYDQMARETMDQWDAIKKYSGLKADFFDPKNDPYPASPRQAIEDINQNNRMSIFSTDDGYGTVAITPEEEALNPMLQQSGERFAYPGLPEGRSARINDIFRVVHDYFGHAKEGVGFRAGGEENAWRSHGSMYSPEALPAVTSETRGQNSWLNYGPKGDKNRTASLEDTDFAEQKIGLMPEWTWLQGLKDSDVAMLIASILGAGSVGALATQSAEA